MIELLQAGPLTSVQDLGRHGLRNQGVSQAGALDPLSLRLANQLVGNPDAAAGLEMLLGGCRLRFTQPVSFALAGCDCGARLDGAPVWPGWCYQAEAGQMLAFSVPRTGLCAYLALRGGIQVPTVLAARATDLQAGFGGLAGRALRAGDRLTLDDSAPLPRRRHGVRLPVFTPVLRLLPGPEYAQFTAASRQALCERAWQVSPRSNRMGFCLEGVALELAQPLELLSHGVFPGVVQVPPDGRPILLGAEAQVTGGYPRIGALIQADLWKLGQLRPGAEVYFQWVDRAEAKAAMARQQCYLARFALALQGGR